MQIIAASYVYWIIAHIPVHVVIFWVSSLFEYLHFGFFVAWLLLQLLTLALLWKYKQLLKLVYGWGDLEDTESKLSAEPTPNPEPEPKVEVPPPEPVEEKKNKTGNVNVTINFTLPQQNGMNGMMNGQPMQYSV